MCLLGREKERRSAHERKICMYIYILCLCIYICIYIYICMYIHTHTHVHTQRGRPAAAGGARRVGVDAEFFAGK